MPPKKRRTLKPQELERAIHFFRVDSGTDDAGQLVPFEPRQWFDEVNRRPFDPQAEGGRYVSTADGEDQCVWVDGPDSVPIDGFEPTRVRFGRLRRNAIPQSERGGELRPIALSADSSLCEISHMLVLPDNLIGVEFNFFAPRAAGLADYIRSITGEPNRPFAIEQLLQRNVLELLDQQQGVRAFELAVRPSYIDTVERANASLGRALRSAQIAGDAHTIGVYLRADPRQRKRVLGNGFMDTVRRIARLTGLPQNSSKAQVRAIGPDGSVGTINLLEDHLVVKKRMPSIGARSRVVDAEAAYAAIREAYLELKSQGLLDVAPSLVVPDGA